MCQPAGPPSPASPSTALTCSPSTSATRSPRSPASLRPDLQRPPVDHDPGLGRPSPGVDARRQEPGQRHAAVQHHLVRTAAPGRRPGIAGTSSTANSMASSRPGQRSSRSATASSTAWSNRCGAGPGRRDVGRQQRRAQAAAAPVPARRDRVGDRRRRPAGQERPGRPGRPAGHGRAGARRGIWFVAGHDRVSVGRPTLVPGHRSAVTGPIAGRPDPARRRRRGGPASRYRAAVARLRRCSRSGCTNPAVATLTFAYADSTAVVGPLATAAEPHSYDLCSVHAQGLTAPKGWEVVRPDEELSTPTQPAPTTSRRWRTPCGRPAGRSGSPSRRRPARRSPRSPPGAAVPGVLTLARSASLGAVPDCARPAALSSSVAGSVLLRARVSGASTGRPRTLGHR